MHNFRRVCHWIPCEIRGGGGKIYTQDNVFIKGCDSYFLVLKIATNDTTTLHYIKCTTTALEHVYDLQYTAIFLAYAPR